MNLEPFRTYRDPQSFLAYAAAIKQYMLAVEAVFSTQTQHTGYCEICHRVVSFKVDSGVHMGTVPNLREGMICPECGLSNRNRLVYCAVRAVAAAYEQPRIAILEQSSLLHNKLKQRFPDLIGSEYLDAALPPGTIKQIHGMAIRHESITDLSYPTGSLDVIVHNDVLEHVYDFRKALAECWRVLAEGGHLVFTCPFLMFLENVSERARPGPDGKDVFLHPAEYHGDPVRPEGALTYWHYGWGLMHALQQTGFRDVAICPLYDPEQGFVSVNHPDYEYGNMLPLVWVARK